MEQLVSAAVDKRIRVIATRVRSPTAPDYLGNGTRHSIALDTDTYTGTTEVSAIVDGVEYDAKNMSADGVSAPEGTLVIKKVED